MDKNDILNTKKCLIGKNLGGALEAIQPLLHDNTYVSLHERISKLTDDYQLMLNYMRNGYPDPARAEVYRSTLRKLDRVTNEALLLFRTQKDSRVSRFALRNAYFQMTYPDIRQHLEDYVSEAALLQLEGQGDDNRRRKLYQDHHQLMSALFDSVCFSHQWHADDREFFVSLILSPATDPVDAALLVSAITLSSITYFDSHKYNALATIYRQATEEVVRQRALVGWALTTTRTHALYPEAGRLAAEMMADEATATQLSEMQMQMFFCINAERDNDKIKRDIMPNLMKNNGFNITRHGIEEKEDDPMQDILDPEASDRAMEELESSFQRMREMQLNGSDIYFGGFSQMKRYPFFYTLSNWFCPFYAEHPDLEPTTAKLQGSKLLQILTDNRPFCDSDKFSFALALATVIDKIPENVKSMINDGAAFGPIADEETLSSPTNIRLMYLQDLYRFFRISDQRVCFYNPFGEKDSVAALFLCSDILKSHAGDQLLLRTGNFLLKRGEFTALKKLLPAIHDTASPQKGVMQGYCHLYDGLYTEATDEFRETLMIAPQSRSALSGLARAAMLSGQFDEAEHAYAQLALIHPEKKNYALNRCIALIKGDRASEAVAPLYQLDYEQPEKPEIMRVLAWCLLVCQRVAQAKKMYERLIDFAPENEDYLNYGYCQWIEGDISQVITLFTQFLDHSGAAPEKLAEELEKDKEVLLANGINESDIFMMLDIVRREREE